MLWISNLYSKEDKSRDGQRPEFKAKWTFVHTRFAQKMGESTAQQEALEKDQRGHSGRSTTRPYS